MNKNRQKEIAYKKALFEQGIYGNKKDVSREEIERAQLEDAIHEQRNRAAEAVSNRIGMARAYGVFKSQVKAGLLAETMIALMSEAYFYQHDKNKAELMARNLVEGYIKECGIDRLINSFKGKSYVLSEFARNIEKYTNIITEKCDKNDPCTFCIEDQDKDNFFEDLKSEDADELATVIKMRVSDAIDQFIDSNYKQKIELKEILQNSKDRMDAAKNENIKEAYEIQAKRAISEYTNNRKMNVLESMITRLSKAALTDSRLKEMYVQENGKLDIDSIVEDCTVMYAFLEMLQTSKIQNIDEAYIKNVLDDICK